MSDEEQLLPELSWRIRSNTLATTIRHGLLLRDDGVLTIPDFQRGLVWTKEQNIRFIESVILGLPIGEYTLHRVNMSKYELLDGQQRWNAIFEYVDNKFPVYGLYWKDLTKQNQSFIKGQHFSHREVSNLTEEERLDVYNRLAYGGTPHEVTHEAIFLDYMEETYIYFDGKLVEMDSQTPYSSDFEYWATMFGAKCNVHEEDGDDFEELWGSEGMPKTWEEVEAKRIPED
jgi:hypothetical protein